MGIRRGIEEATKDAIDALKKMAKPIKTDTEIRQVATISAESEVIGAIIADTIKKIGKDGVVTVEESQTFGVDSEIVEKMMDEGELPNFSQLKSIGSYAPLSTALPAQSPVAWSTFATGLNPGGHGLYDFLWRHKDSYMPDIALSEMKPGKVLTLFGKQIPLWGGGFVNRRIFLTTWIVGHSGSQSPSDTAE